MMHRPRGLLRACSRRLTGTLLGVLFVTAGTATIGYVVVGQTHAPAPGRAQAGRLRTVPNASSAVGLERARVLAPSRPVSLSIPAIDLNSPLLEAGLNPNGTIAVPPLLATPSEPAWYRYSPTPGALGPAVILGHVDSYRGPAIFFRLAALRPGDRIDVGLQDGVTAVFVVDGVREYAKARFPSTLVYGRTDFAALRLITCGGSFDSTTRSYLDNVVVFASLEGRVESR